jgi:cyclase
MLRSRIIPVLLVRKKGLVKTIKFSDDKYVGDPLNAVRIFNEKEADELAIFDIDATVIGNDPDYEAIESWAAECRMPLCYGGGIKNIEQALRILSLGVEKVALSSAILEDNNIVKEISSQVGSQSVVAVLDVKKTMFSGYKVFVNNGSKQIKGDLLDIICKLEDQGIGEVVINNIDSDGTMSGFDFNLISRLKNHVQVPLTYLGGASDLNDIKELIHEFSPIGIAAGSLFVFKGKYRAVLINYPNSQEKDKLFTI